MEQEAGNDEKVFDEPSAVTRQAVADVGGGVVLQPAPPPSPAEVNLTELAEGDASPADPANAAAAGDEPAAVTDAKKRKR